MEEKDKSEDLKTISNRFLDPKNGLVRLKPINYNIFGGGLFFIHCNGWTRMEEKDKSENLETISNRFLDPKNGLVRLKPINCNIFEFLYEISLRHSYQNLPWNSLLVI